MVSFSHYLVCILVIIKPRYRIAILCLLFLSLWVVWMPTSIFAAAETWDGGGTDGTCGGGAGDGNKWSCAANWVSNTVPNSSDTVVFDATSTKAATIDTAFTIQGMTIATGYTDTITMAGNLTLTAATGFVHNTTDGVFTWSSGTLSFTGSAAQVLNVDTDDTFGPLTIAKSSSSTIGVTVTSGDTVPVSGDLTLTDGNLNT